MLSKLNSNRIKVKHWTGTELEAAKGGFATICRAAFTLLGGTYWCRATRSCGIKKMHSRWGSCNIRSKRIWHQLDASGTNHIELVDYVLVHELVQFT